MEVVYQLNINQPLVIPSGFCLMAVSERILGKSLHVQKLEL